MAKKKTRKKARRRNPTNPPRKARRRSSARRRRNPGMPGPVVALGAGTAGAVVGVAGSWGLSKIESLSPGWRAGIVLGTGLLTGGLVGMASPALGAGLAGGMLCAGGAMAVQAVQVGTLKKANPAAKDTAKDPAMQKGPAGLRPVGQLPVGRILYNDISRIVADDLSGAGTRHLVG